MMYVYTNHPQYSHQYSFVYANYLTPNNIIPVPSYHWLLRGFPVITFSFNLFRPDLGHIYSFIKCKLFQQYCCSVYAAPLCLLNSEATEDICIAWRTALRMLTGLHPMTHCDILAGLSNLKPLDVQLKYSFICFLKKCLDHDNAKVKIVALIALNNPMSCAGNRYKHILSKYQNVFK